MKSRVILALLIGSSITLSACGQAAQGTEVAADEGVLAESVVDDAESESTAVAESDTAESSTSSKKKGTHSDKKTDSSSESSSGTLAYSLSDGESISGGTYDAENEDESAIGAGGTVSASVSWKTARLVVMISPQKKGVSKPMCSFIRALREMQRMEPVCLR